jgi:hypothetical protein
MRISISVKLLLCLPFYNQFGAKSIVRERMDNMEQRGYAKLFCSSAIAEKILFRRSSAGAHLSSEDLSVADGQYGTTWICKTILSIRYCRENSFPP